MNRGMDIACRLSKARHTQPSIYGWPAAPAHETGTALPPFSKGGGGDFVALAKLKPGKNPPQPSFEKGGSAVVRVVHPASRSAS